MSQQRSIVIDPPSAVAVAAPEAVFRRDSATRMAYWLVGYFAFLQGGLGLIMPFLRAELHLDYTLASLHFSAFALGAVASGVITDRALARWNRGNVLWVALAGMAVWTLLLIAAPTPLLTIPAALLMGTCGNIALISLQAALSDRHGRWRTTALAEANVAASLASILASVVVGVVTGFGLGWRISLLLPIVVLIGVRWRYSADARGDDSSVREVKQQAASPALPRRYWLIWLMIALETGAEWCFIYWGASFLGAQGGLSKSDAASVMSAYFVAMLLGRIVGSRLSRRVDGLVLVLIALTCAVVGFPIVWLAPSSVVRVVGLFIVGLGLANVYPLSLGLATGSAPAQADRALARLAIGCGSAILLAPFLVGALADHLGIGRAFGIALPLLLASLALAALLRWMSSVGAPVQTMRIGHPPHSA